MSLASQLTYSGIGLAVFAEQLCLPVPSGLLLMTAGALIARNEGHWHVVVVLLAAVVGSVLADVLWFWLGRRWGAGVIRLVCSLTSDPRASRERSERLFDSWGLRLLLIAKFVPGLNGVSPPLAGAEGTRTGIFLAYDSAGALLWSSAYVLLGFAFADQLDVVVDAIQRFGAIVAIIVGLPLLTFVAIRALRIYRMIRHLRLKRISPAMLRTKIDQADRIAILDLKYYEAREGTIEGIAGAFRVDPGRLRRSGRIAIPEGLELILYCSSKNEFVSARAAGALQRAGISDVWVLDGGLEAWVREGFPVTSELATAEEAAARVGVILPRTTH